MSQIVLPPVAPPAEDAPMKMNGSPLTAAARDVQLRTNEQSAAVENLGGKMTGGATVELKNIPTVPSAGNSNPAGVFAGMKELEATQAENSKYDALGNAPAQKVGGKRRSRKHKKHGGKVRKHTRKHSGSSRKSRSVRHSRRRVHSHSGKKTNKK